MARFVLTAAANTFAGQPGQFNLFYFTPSTLQAADVITGGATGTFLDEGILTAGGTVSAAQFGGVSGLEELDLSSGGNSVTLPDALVAGSSTGFFTVTDSGSFGWSVAASADVDGDGKADLVWRRADGTVAIDPAAGDPNALVTPSGGGASDWYEVGTEWHVNSLADFNGDGKSDILWRNGTDGSVVQWQLDGTQIQSNTSLGSIGLEWSAAATGDFSGDGKSDIIWRNNSTGSVVEWQLNGSQIVSNTQIGLVGLEWHVVGAGDFNGDHKSDILWRSDDGTVSLWQMDGNTMLSNTNFGKVGAEWHIVGTADFNGDGKTDILWRADDGTLAEWQMNGTQIASNISFGVVGQEWQLVSTGDYNGDGKTDILWRNGNDGTVVVWNLNGSQVQSQQVVTGGNDTIDASAAVNGSVHAYIGTGSDTVIGGALADQIFTPNSNFASIDGGGGDDRLVLTSPGQVFSLTANAAKIHNTEVLWLADAANTNVTLGGVDIAQVSASANYLYVVGGPDDHVSAGSGWTAVASNVSSAAIAAGHTFNEYAYSNGSLLFVDSTIALSIAANPTVPVDANGGANTVVEGVAAGAAVGVTASSFDPLGATVTYSLTNNAGGRFAINATTGVVTVANASLIDFESATGHAYSITAQASDASGASSQTFTINVTDVAPTAPVDANGATNTISEGASNGTVVGITASSSDINGGTLTYSLTDNAGGRFAINSSTGVVTVANAALVDFESSAPGHTYSITAQASDGTLATAQTFTIAVTDVAPSTPVDSNGAPGGSVAEGAANGTTVGVTVSSSDISGGTLTYSLIGDTSGGGFVINSSTGVVTVANAALLDFENTAPGHSYTITARASDGTLATAQTFTIAVTDVAPSVPGDSDGAANTVVEGAANGTVVGVTAFSTDVNGGPLTYSLTGDTSVGGFTINATTGVITVADSTKINFETAPGHAYSVTAQASDGTLTSSQTFTIAVTDVAPSAPVDSDGAIDTVAEGAANGSTVGVTAFSTDINGPGVTYSLTGDTSNGGFTIDSATGVVRVADSTKLDFETTGPGHAYTVTAQASDGTLSNSQTFTIAVTNVDPSTPIDSDGDLGGEVAEGAAAGTNVGLTASSTDPNGPAVTYAIIADSSVGGFQIDSHSGVVTVLDGSKINFESAQAYSLTVQAVDGVGAVSTQVFTVAVDDINDNAPIFTSGATATEPEETAQTAVVYTAHAPDADGTAANNTVTYSIGINPDPPTPVDPANADAALFTIDATTGEVRFKQPPNFENALDADHDNSYQIIIHANDGVHDVTQAVTIGVTDINDNAPVFDQTITTASVAENTSMAYDAHATDADGTAPNNTITYSLTGDDAARFNIDTAGVITFKVAPNFESPADADNNNVYLVTVHAIDNGVHDITHDLTITVTDVNDIAPQFSSGTTATEAENTDAATVVYTAHANDTDASAAFNTVHYALQGGVGDNDLFHIDADTGAVTFNASPDFEAPAHADNVYHIVVTASDGVPAHDATQGVAITVTDLNDNAPVFDVNVVAAITSENISTSTVIVDGHASDADGTLANNTITYSLTGDDASQFHIDTNGAVTFITSPDFENPSDLNANNVYLITIHAKDGVGPGAHDTAHDVTITVTDAPDIPPAFTSGTTGTEAEGSLAGNVVYHATTSPSSGVTFSLTGGLNDNDLFNIDSGTGDLTFKVSPNFESHPAAYVVTVQANAAGGFHPTQDVTISVTDVAPSAPANATGSINEGQGDTAPAVATGIELASTDPGGDAVNFTLSNSAGGRFAIDSSDPAHIKIVTGPNASLINYETSGASHSYTVTVVASTTNGTATSSNSYTINVGDVAPLDPTTDGDPNTPDKDASANRIATTAADGTPVGITAFWNDPNGGPLTYSFVGGTQLDPTTQLDSTGTFALDINTGMVTLANSHATLTAEGTHYDLLIEASDGVSTTAAQTFTVDVTNNTPTIDLDTAAAFNGYTASFIEGGADLAISNANIAITDPASTQLVSATVTLTNAKAGDTLVGTNVGSITASAPVFDAGAGTITITLIGNDTLAHYQTAIHDIVYGNTSQNPDETTRDITVKVNDGANDSNIAHTLISVAAVNDAPVIAKNGSDVPSAPAFTENGAAAALLKAGTVSDLDSPSNFLGGSFTITVDTPQVDDQIVLTGAGFTITGSTLFFNGLALGTISSLAPYASGGTYAVTVTSLTTLATPSVVNSLLEAFSFRSVSENPTGPRTIEFTFDDGGHSGTGLGGVSTSAAVTQTVTITPVNDAPVAANGTLAVLEDSGANSGQAVATDVDNTQLQLTYVLVGANGGAAHGTVSMNTDGSYTYTPTGNFNGTDTFSFNAHDLGPLTSNNATITVTVGAVNDAPAGADTTISTAEDTAHVFTAADFGFSDSNDAGQAAGANAFLAVKITQLATAGSLTLNGAAVTLNQSVLVSDINKGLLLFTPGLDGNGTGYANFKFAVQDNGGTANTGVDLDQSPNTITIDVSAVNDAPVNHVPFGTVAATENADFHITTISVSDVDAISTDIETTALSTSHGDLTVSLAGGATIVGGSGTNGSHSFTLSGTIAQLNAALADITYHADSNYLGPDTLTVLTDDDGNTGTDPGLTGTPASEADTDTVAIQVSAAVQTGLTSQLWYVTFGGDPTPQPTFSDNVVGYLNSDGSAPVPIQDTGATSQNENDIALYSAPGLYFVATDGFTVESHHTNDGTIAEAVAGAGTLDLSSYFTVDSVADDPFLNPDGNSAHGTLFVGVTGADPQTTGILEVGFAGTGDLSNSTHYLITQASFAPFHQAIDFAVELGAHSLYYVDDDVVGGSNQIFLVDYSVGSGGVATNLTSATAVSNLTDFPLDGTNGFIEAVAVNPYLIADSTSDDIVYFLVTGGTAGDSLWYIDRGSATPTAATEVTGITLTGVGTHAGLAYDSVSDSLFITDQGNSSILQAHLDLVGHVDTVANTYTTDQLTGHAVTGTPVPGPLALDILATLTVHGGAFAEINPTSTATALDALASVTDPDLLLVGATVTLTGGFVGSGDVLAADVSSTNISIASNTTDANGNITLVLSGLDTTTNYSQVLQLITFNSGNNPTNFGNNITRAITWHVNDGAQGDPVSDSNTVTTTLTVAGADDAPTAVNGVASTNEDTAFAGQAVATDVDNTPAQLIYTLVGPDGGALHGTVTMDSHGAFIYVPDGDYNSNVAATDVFTFHVTDGTLGTSSDGTITVTVDPVNDAPVVTTSNGATSANEQIATAVDANVTVSDVDSLTLDHATVSITGNFQAAEDVLAFVNNNGATFGNIAAVYNSGTGVLALTSSGGTATTTQWQNALRAVTYDDTSDTPNTAARTISFVANDGSLDSTVATKTVNVVAVNDAPLLDLDTATSPALDANAYSTAYTVTGAAVPVTGTVGISDFDNSIISSAHVALTDAQTGDALAVVGGLPAGITATFSNSNQTVDLSGDATWASYQTALHEIAFSTFSNASTVDRHIDISVKDDGGLSSNTATTTITPVTADPGPTAVADTVTRDELGGTNNGTSTVDSGAITGNVLTNDTDTPLPKSLSVVAFGTGATGVGTDNGTLGTALLGTYGTLTINADGTFTYAVDNALTATQQLRSTDHVQDVFHYTAQDPGGLQSTADFTATVNGAEDKPLAINDLGAMGEDSAATSFEVRANDSQDPDAGAANTIAVNSPINITNTLGLTFVPGDVTAVVNSGTKIQITLGAAFQQLKNGETATVDVPYTLTGNDDGNPDPSTGHLMVTVNGADDLPLAKDDDVTITEDADLATRTVSVLNDNGHGADVLDLDHGALNTIAAGSISVAAVTGHPEIDQNDVTVALDGTSKKIIVTLLPDFQKLQIGEHANITVHYTLQGNAGELSGADLHLTVNGVNDMPVVTVGTAGSFTENAAAQAVVPNLTITDLDNTTLSQVVVTLTNAKTDDSLSVSGSTTSGEIGAGLDDVHFVVDNTAHTVTFTPGAGATPTLTDFQNAVHQVQFVNPDDNLDATTRTFTVSATDTADGTLANDLTGTANANFAVTAVNDAPVNTIPAGDHYANSFTSTPITGLSIADADANPNNVQVTLSLDHGGTITLPTNVSNGLVAGSISGNGSSSVVINDTLAHINTTLGDANGVIYKSASGFGFDVAHPANNVETLQVTTNDLGHNPGPAAADQDPLSIGVLPKVWFIDINASGGGDGSQAHPFNTLAAFDAATTGTGDYVYLRAGTYNGTLTLQNGQTLIGAGDDLTFPDPLHPAGMHLVEAHTTAPTINATGGVIGIDLANGNTIHGLNVTTAGSTDIGIDDGTGGASVGNLSISNMSITGVGKAIDIDHGGALSVTLDHLSSTGSSTQGINLGGGLTGTFTSGSSGTHNDIHGSTGTAFNLTGGGSLSVTYNGEISQASNAALVNVGVLTGPAHTGTLTFQNGTLTATNGSGLQFDNADGTYNFNGTNTLSNTVVNATANAGINIVDGSNGTFSFSSNSSITHQQGGGTAVNINGGGGDFTYAGAIGATDATDGNGLSVSVQNHTAGTVAFSGNILDGSDGGGGIFLNANTGGTYNFTGASQTFNTGGSAGVNLTGNAGATINFNPANGGNGLDITTSSGTGFNATGAGPAATTGGTVNVQGSGNSIHTGAGIALNVVNTTIGSNNLTFHDIADNGGSSGIVLNNTGASGHLTVSGDGSAVTNGTNSSGGTIQSTTGAGISLTNTLAPSFTNMLIQNISGSGINGTGVNGFTFHNGKIDNTGTGGAIDSSNIAFDANGTTATNLTGAVSITGNVLNNSRYHGVDIQQAGGTISALDISNNSFTSSTSGASSLGTAIRFSEYAAAGVGGATINNNTIQNFPSGAGIIFQGGLANASTGSGTFGSVATPIVITGNTIAGQAGVRMAGQGVNMSTDGTANSHFNISNNSVTDVQGVGIAYSSFGNSTATGVMNNNTITSNSNVNGQPGIAVGADFTNSTAEAPSLTITLNNNTTHATQGNGILALANGHGTLDATITNNHIDAPLGGVRQGILVRSGNNTAGEDATVFLDISGNTSAPSVGQPAALGIGLRKQGTTPTVNDFSIEDMTGNGATPNVESYVNGKNPAGGGTLLVSAQSGFTSVNRHPMLAADGGVQASSPTVVGAINQGDVDSVVAAAISQWALAGASPSQLAAMQAIHFVVADLSDNIIGNESSGRIAIDIDGAGHGWFVDPTPNDNSEFTHAQNAAGTDLLTDPSSAAAGHLDLLTVVTHELGHVIGLEDSTAAGDANDLMYINLVDGERRLPDGMDVAQAQQADTAHLAEIAEAALPAGAVAPNGTPILAGTDGNDTLYSGAGNVILVGGAGADTFVFDQAPQLAAAPPQMPGAPPQMAAHDATPPVLITHIADYSAAQGDTIDVSALFSPGSGQVQAHEDASGSFAILQVSSDPAHGSQWISIAQLDGVHEGDAINVIVDATHVPQQIHADWLA
jgi:VCBS repeat-containing protein